MTPTTCNLAPRRASALIIGLLSVLFCCSSLSAQEPDPESFFPHHLGDTWVYFIQNGVGDDTLIDRITFDSLGSDGAHYIRMHREQLTPAGMNYYPWYDTYRIDTSGHVCAMGFLQYNVLVYNLRAPRNIPWVVDTMYGPVFNLGMLMDYYADRMFNVPTMIKVIGFFSSGDSNATTGLGQYGEMLASGFGVVWRGSGDLGYAMYLMAASIGGEVFGDTSLLSTVSVRPPLDQPLPQDLRLAQNYPNPFNGSTWIEFFLPNPERVALEVYDILGREVATLTNARLGSGIHRYQWQADGIASGVYFCVLKIGNTLQARKMVIQR